MTGEHVGRQSDAIDNDSDIRAAMRERMKIKPTGRTFRGVSEQGDGDPCPVEGHGRKYRLTSGQWCPHQSHDMGVPR